MYKNFEWNENFEIGIQEIDEQHKMLINYLNALLKESESGITHSPEEIKKVFANASLFLGKHCKSEENLMLDIKYPYEEYKIHYNSHSAFCQKLRAYHAMDINESNWKEFFINFTALVLNWIKAHETSDDIILAKFIKDDIKYGQKLKLKLKEFFKNNIL